MGKTSDDWEVTGALAVTGASTMTGAVTFSGGIDAAQQTNYLTNYAGFILDSDGFKIWGCKVYDQYSGAYKTLYVYNGSVLTM